MSLALLSPTTSTRRLIVQGYVRGHANIPHSHIAELLRPVLIRVGIFSVVRGHNVARVNKSYQSFGDRFATVVINDVICWPL